MRSGGFWKRCMCSMDVILGGTGHVGRVVAETLLAAGHEVTVVSRRGARSTLARSFSTVALDVTDTSALQAVFQKALQGIHLEKLVVQSTYGAQRGEHCGDLGVLYELEQGAFRLDVPVCIVRAAYYMSNWAGLLKEVKVTGVMKTLLPSAQAFPMVAPEDVGHFAGQMLLSNEGQDGIYNIEGPKAYTPTEVADVFTNLLGRSVQAQSVPQDEWYATYLANGFSAEAARSYATMTGLFVHQHYELPIDPHRGPTDLETCLRGFL